MRFFDDCDTSDGFLLDKLLNLLASVIRVAQDCGTLCALYSLLSCIHPRRAGTKFSYFNSGGVPKNNKRTTGQVVQEHVLDHSNRMERASKVFWNSILDRNSILEDFLKSNYSKHKLRKLFKEQYYSSENS